MPPVPTSLASAWNLPLIESQYLAWQQDPASVDREWQIFFSGLTENTRA